MSLFYFKPHTLLREYDIIKAIYFLNKIQK